MPGPQVLAGGYGGLLAVADLNRDGRPDVAESDPNRGPGAVTLLLQDAADGFQLPAVYDPSFYPLDLAVGDLLGNGNSDIVTVAGGTQTGVVHVLFNRVGNGVLDPPVAYDAGLGGMGVAIGDVNGDGYADIVVAQGLSGVSIFWGAPAGTFANSAHYPSPSEADGVAVADFDGDGTLDLATGGTTGGMTVWLNQGDGGFVAFTFSAPGADLIIAADVNGDGKPDLIATDARIVRSMVVSVFLNQGAGVFSGPALYDVSVDSMKGLAVGDVDGDGRPDLVATLETFGAAVWHNMGDGGFAQAQLLPLGAPNLRYGATGLSTFGNGRLPDILLPLRSSSFSVLMPNAGDGGFPVPLPPVAYGGFPFTVADIDGDGRPDVVTPAAVILNDSGFPSTLLRMPLVTDNVSILTTGDLNGDGRPDVVMGGTQLYVELNDGGAFTVANAYAPGVSAVTGLALGDFNADGRVDVAATGIIEGLVGVLLNDGSGHLLSASTFDAGAAPTGIVALDVNGDGALDLATVNSNQNTIAVLLGRGDGSFGPPSFYSVGTNPHAIAVGDLNGDGLPDLVVGNSLSRDVSIILNSSSGLLPATTVSIGFGAESVTVTDIDSDGRPDIAIAGNYASAAPFDPFPSVVVLLTEPGGKFQRREYVVGVSANTYYCPPPTGNLMFADFNSDGRPDVAATCGSGKMVVQLTSCFP